MANSSLPEQRRAPREWLELLITCVSQYTEWDKELPLLELGRRLARREALDGLWTSWLPPLCPARDAEPSPGLASGAKCQADLMKDHPSDRPITVPCPKCKALHAFSGPSKTHCAT